VLRNIFGSKRDKVTGEWRRLHNEELYDLYSSPNIIQVIKSIIMRWAGHVVCLGGKERCMQGFGGETCWERPRYRWEDNNKMDLQEVG
jgi:hypothetical protein